MDDPTGPLTDQQVEKILRDKWTKANGLPRKYPGWLKPGHPPLLTKEQKRRTMLKGHYRRRHGHKLDSEIAVTKLKLELLLELKEDSSS